MILRFRLDKTAKAGTRVHGRFCNLDCVWCHHDYFRHDNITAITNYQFIECIERVIDATSAKSVIVRIAGDGEPTLVGEQELVDLVVRLKNIPAVREVKLTTNGILLGSMSQSLVEAGLDSATVSLNSLSPKGYSLYSQRNKLASVLDSIDRSFKAKLPIKINTIYSSLNIGELEAFEALSVKYDGLVIKFFDLIPGTSQPGYEYVPLGHLEQELSKRNPIIEEIFHPYAQRIYKLPSGAVFVVKTAGQVNNCPNLSCHSRERCVEGCRNSIRIRLDGVMQPCGVRTDNQVDLLTTTVTSSDVRSALISGGKLPPS